MLQVITFWHHAKYCQVKWFWMPFCVYYKVRESKETMQTYKTSVLIYSNQGCSIIAANKNRSWMFYVIKHVLKGHWVTAEIINEPHLRRFRFNLLHLTEETQWIRCPFINSNGTQGFCEVHAQHFVNTAILKAHWSTGSSLWTDLIWCPHGHPTESELCKDYAELRSWLTVPKKSFLLA